MESYNALHNVPALKDIDIEAYFSRRRMEYVCSDEWKRIETDFKRELKLHNIQNDWEQLVSYLRVQKESCLQAFRNKGLVANLWNKSFSREKNVFDVINFLRKLCIVSDGEIDSKDLQDFFQYYCLDHVIEVIMQEALRRKQAASMGVFKVFINKGDVSFDNCSKDEDSLSSEVEEVYKNFIFKTKIFDSNARLSALRNTVAHAIDMGENNLMFGEPNSYSINPKIQSEWYYIMRALEEAEIVTRMTVPNFINQMLDWYPWFSNEFQNVEEMVAYKRKIAKCISHEKSLWKYGKTREVTKLKDMWARFQSLGIDAAKVERMYNAVYLGLLQNLLKLKQNIEKQQAGQ